VACVVDGQYGVCHYILFQYVRAWKREGVGICMCFVLVGYGYGVSARRALWCVLWMGIVGMVCVLDGLMGCVIIVCSSV